MFRMIAVPTLSAPSFPRYLNLAVKSAGCASNSTRPRHQYFLVDCEGDVMLTALCLSGLLLRDSGLISVWMENPLSATAPERGNLVTNSVLARTPDMVASRFFICGGSRFFEKPPDSKVRRPDIKVDGALCRGPFSLGNGVNHRRMKLHAGRENTFKKRFVASG